MNLAIAEPQHLVAAPLDGGPGMPAFHDNPERGLQHERPVAPDLLGSTETGSHRTV